MEQPRASQYLNPALDITYGVCFFQSCLQLVFFEDLFYICISNRVLFRVI